MSRILHPKRLATRCLTQILTKYCNKEIVEKFNIKKQEIAYILQTDLLRQFRKETGRDKGDMLRALYNRILVYNGGGSTYNFLTKPMDPFTDIKLIDSNMWKEVNIVNKDKVSTLCQLLATAYGLSIGDSDAEVKLSMFTTLFDKFEKSQSREFCFIDKDQC